MLDRVTKALGGLTTTLAALLLCSATAAAQTTPPAPSGAQQPTPSSPQPTTATTDTTSATRPATTTTLGDTGLWFVPTGEILPARKWSFSFQRTNLDYNQGFTDVSVFPVTIGVGVGDRAEIFGAVQTDVRIDRDIRPIFVATTPDQKYGGAINEYPMVKQGWTGDNFGDVWVGAKINLLSQYRQQPLAFGVRAMVKLPTADETKGAGTGKADWAIDAIVSKEINDRVEVSGFGGFIVRGDPTNWDLANGFRWG